MISSTTWDYSGMPRVGAACTVGLGRREYITHSRGVSRRRIYLRRLRPMLPGCPDGQSRLHHRRRCSVNARCQGKLEMECGAETRPLALSPEDPALKRRKPTRDVQAQTRSVYVGIAARVESVKALKQPCEIVRA